MTNKEIKQKQKRLEQIYVALEYNLGSSEMDLVNELVDLEVELTQLDGR